MWFRSGLLLLIIAAKSAATSVPFGQYPGERPLVGEVAFPKLDSARARHFRTVLREAAATGPNFNGHYRIASWGCGTNCLDWAVINLETGDVWFPKEPATSCSGRLDRDGTDLPDWFEMRLDSSLLALHVCTGPGAPFGDHVFDTRQLFVWRENALTHLRNEPLRYWRERESSKGGPNEAIHATAKGGA